MKHIYTLPEAEVKLTELTGIESKIEINASLADSANSLAKELPTKKWTLRDNIIRFFVTSDGTTGKEWIKRLEDKGINIGHWAEDVLRSKDFKPTKTKYEIAVIKGSLFTQEYPTTEEIRDKAKELKFKISNAEVACLIRELLTDKDIEEMGLWWITTFHKPIKDSVGDPELLNAYRNGDGSWLGTSFGQPDNGWDRGHGFAFVVSQVEL